MEKPIPASVKIISKWIHKILKRTVSSELMDCLMKSKIGVSSENTSLVIPFSFNHQNHDCDRRLPHG